MWFSIPTILYTVTAQEWRTYPEQDTITNIANTATNDDTVISSIGAGKPCMYPDTSAE